MRRKILITGAAGFVGRHFVKRFLELGDDVYAVDSLAKYTGAISPSHGWPLFEPRDFDSFYFRHTDCREFFLRKESKQYFDYVFHLAAMVGGRLMIENNPLAVADDLSIDTAYWQWAVENKPGKTICFSSSASYPISYQGLNNYTLLKESMINFDKNLGMPDLSYGWAKLTHEYLAKLAFEKHEIKSVIYRPFSGYGEDQDDSYPFPSICKRVINHFGKKALRVWGTGEQMRDFIHIEDCVDGVLKTMDKIDNADALNLSTGIFTSFKDFAFKAAKQYGYQPSIEGMTDKPSGVHARAGDTAKQIKFGFQYKINFDEGINRALKYFDSIAGDKNSKSRKAA